MTLKSLAAIALLAAALLPAAAAKSKPVDCELVVKGQTYIKERCAYTPGKGGSFQMASKDYFVQLDVTGKDVGEAHWNTDPQSTHAQARLGTVKRKGACWSNADAKICARALSDSETRAAVAKQPNGMMLWPNWPGGSACVGVEDDLKDGATVLMHNCQVPADLIFVAAADGTLSIDKHPELCIGMESPGMSNPPVIVLLTCDANSTKWRWMGKKNEAGIVRSADGFCWTVPQETIDPQASFPWMIEPQPCGSAQPIELNLSKS